MAEITNPQIVKFANERARTLADRMTSLMAAIQAYQADYSAQTIASQIAAAGPTNLIADGSETDGRPRILGSKLLDFSAALAQLVTAWNVTAVAGVGATVATIQNQLQVNGSPR